MIAATWMEDRTTDVLEQLRARARQYERAQDALEQPPRLRWTSAMCEGLRLMEIEDKMRQIRGWRRPIRRSGDRRVT